MVMRDMLRRPFATFIVAWWLIAAGTLWVTATHLEEEARAQVQAAETGAANALDTIVEATERLFDAVSVLHGMAQLLSDHAGLPLEGDARAAFDVAIHDTMRNFVRENRFGITHLAFIDPDGRLAWSTLPGWRPVDLSDREYFQVHALHGRQDVFVSAPVLGRASNRWGVRFTRPMRRADGGFAGVAVVAVDPGWISGRIGGFLMAPSDLVGILRNPGGIVIARQPGMDSRIGQQAALPGNILRDHARGLIAPRTVHHSPLTQNRSLLLQRQVGDSQLVAAYMIDLDALAARGAARRTGIWAIVSLGLLLVLVAGFAAIYRASCDMERRRKTLIDDNFADLPVAVYRARISAAGDRRILYASPNLPGIAGTAARAAPDDMADWHGRDGPHGGDALGGFIDRLRADGTATLEYPIRDGSGRLRLLRENAQIIRRIADGGVEVSGYLTDVTMIRSLERAAADAGRLASLGELATEVAHEMNQPLNTALLAAENAEHDLDENDIPRVRVRLRRIVDSLERTGRITDHLRRLARGDTSKDLVPVSVEALADGCLLVIGGTLRQARIVLHRDFPPDLPRVLAQPLLFEQVLVNLLTNARDAFVAQDVERRSVTMSARASGDTVELRVADNAGGMPPEILERIFEPFFSSKPQGEGTGLGLSIARQSIAGMGGTIDAETTEDGTTFVIRLRAARPDSTLAADAMREPA